MALLLFAAILLSAADTLWAERYCCSNLPCYHDDPPFNGLPRPECPDEQEVEMEVYTRQNPTKGETISRKTIPPAFKSGVKTVILVPGFYDYQDYPQWLREAKDALLAKDDYNVIIVSYVGMCQPTLKRIPKVVSNTRTIGGEISLVVRKTINDKKSTRTSWICVGANTGAHICGHAGQHFKIGRIIGLDPFGIIFEDRDWSIGLNPSCADQVDVIHTDGNTSESWGVGTLKRLGHVDFYPNGGKQQPGCAVFESPQELRKLESGGGTFVFRIPQCSSKRSQIYFLESIATPCFHSRYNCTDQTRLPASCTNRETVIQSMGFNADQYPARGIFYLTTKALSYLNKKACLG